MRRQELALVAVVPALVVAAWVYDGRAFASLAQSTAPSGERWALRVRFGTGDKAPARWDGSVDAEGGKVVSLRHWRPRPGDEILGVSGWKISTRQGQNFRYRSWEEEPDIPPAPYLLVTGIIVEVSGTAATRLRFRTAQGDFVAGVADTGDGKAIGFLGERVLVDRVPLASLVSGDGYENDFVSLAAGPGGEVWVAWVAYRKWANEVLVRRWDGKAWNAAAAVTGKPGDVYQVKLGRDGNGNLWAVWAAQSDGNWDLYARRFDGRAWGAIERLTSEGQPDIHPALATDAKGNLWLAWQGFRNGQSDVFARYFDGTRWSEPERVSASNANDWLPAVAADSKGRVYVAWDTYDKGNYDIVLRRCDGASWEPVRNVASSLRLEANVALACDREDRLWAAWNESGMQWGKDTGLLVRRPATGLYRDRTLAVAVYANGEWSEPTVEVEASLPPDLRHFNDLPVLQADGAGRMWLLFRHRYARIPGVPPTAALHGAGWEVIGTAYDGARWTPPVEFPFSAGRSDMRVAATVDGTGTLRAAWATDNRDYDDLTFRHGSIYTATAPKSPGSPVPAQLRPRVEPELRSFPVHSQETADLTRIRSFEMRSEGKGYRIYRGDIHRHTEISRDGKNDGSMLDTYRYALDAAGLDFLGMSDHNGQGGPDIEYINWLLQQLADVFHLPGRFTPLFGYERGLPFPNGHRNVMFAMRGNPTLPTPQEEIDAKTGSAALYAYLKRYQGIAVSHTPATSMGTDWRDNDPAVEPLVEIYQGDRTSAEHEGAPKASSRADVTSHAGGYQPEGFVWNAWAKGYKLGVQASSDHLSTHISYACTLSTEFTRQGLLDAMRRRHSYGATDNIILDYRIRNGAREYMQGDIAEISGSFQLIVKVIGTARIRQIDIIRSNTYLHTVQNLGSEAEFTFVDSQPLPGESYYYVRVQQANEQMAWSSPVWIKR